QPPPDTTFKEFVADLARDCTCSRPPLPWLVTITRISPKSLDRNNLGGALKRVIDAVARWVQVDDREDGRAGSRVDYDLKQRQGPAGVFRVAIRIETRTPALMLARAELELVEQCGPAVVAEWHRQQAGGVQ